MTPVQRDKLIQQTVVDINQGLYDNLKSLENQVADIVAQGVDPIIARGEILSAFEQYSASVKDIVNVKPIAEKQVIGTRTVEDESNMDSLALIAQDSVGGALRSGAEDVIKTVVLGTAAGIGTAQLVGQVRGRISGVLMETSDPVARKAQTALKRFVVTSSRTPTPGEIQQLTRVIKERLTGVNTSASVRDLTSTTVKDAVMSFDAAFTKNQATRKGITKFRYDGGGTDSPRDWCLEHEGATYTEEEIYQLWESNDWAGKSSSDPFVSRGGYNCTHFWTPINED